jgi:hypothetical protein
MSLNQRTTARAIRRLLVSAVLLSLTTLTPARAVPSFSPQTSQPCSSCHIGAFGARLTQAGRDFKLYGYASSDNRKHQLPFNVNARVVFAHTDADIAGGAADGFDVNDNLSLDGVTVSYAGAFTAKSGGMIRLAYNGIKQTWAWGGIDLRYAGDQTLLGYDAVLGAYINNGPARSDLWESATSGAPTQSSGLPKKPRGSFLVNAIGGVVAGAGFYAQVADTLYIEAALYSGLNRDTLNALGVDPLNGADSIRGAVPYARVAATRDFGGGRHNVELGVMALQATVYPADVQSAGYNTITNVGGDVNYRFTMDPASSTSDVIAARIAVLHEREELDASHVLKLTRSRDVVDTFKADITYAIDATYTLTTQYFDNGGTKDAARWGGNGNIDTRGWMAQVDYVPWGKPDSPADWVNLRLTAQYTRYDEFNGDRINASDRNAFLIGVTIAGTSNQ